MWFPFFFGRHISIQRHFRFEPQTLWYGDKDGLYIRLPLGWKIILLGPKEYKNLMETPF